jgi:hypothetical protein
MREWVDLLFSAKSSVIKQWFDANPSSTNRTWSLDALVDEIEFDRDDDPDLFFALGAMWSENLTVDVNVVRQRPGDGTERLEASAYLLRGTLTDLIDFDFDDGSHPFSRNAAIVQAGYNGIGRSGGHVYKVEADFAGSGPVAHDHVFASYAIP